jgi:hypothetical protein
MASIEKAIETVVQAVLLDEHREPFKILVPNPFWYGPRRVH